MSRNPIMVLTSDVEAVLAGRCLTEGQRRTGDEMAAMLETIVAEWERTGPHLEDGDEERDDVISRMREAAGCWRSHMEDEDARAAAAQSTTAPLTLR